MTERAGRTYWWAKDAAWWRRERIVELAEEFGPAGPAVIDWLSCEAKAQNDNGWVKTGYRSVGRGCFVEPVTVGHVVSRAVALCLLDEFTEDDGRFTCRISGWQHDQQRVEATLRKRVQRTREASKDGESEDASHDTSRDVTDCPKKSLTGQDRREQHSPQPPKGGEAAALNSARERLQTEAPIKPTGNRSRDQGHYHERIQAWTAEHFPGCSVKGIEQIVSWARRDGTPATPEAVRAFAEAAPNFTHLIRPTEAAA